MFCSFCFKADNIIFIDMELPSVSLCYVCFDKLVCIEMKKLLGATNTKELKCFHHRELLMEHSIIKSNVRQKLLSNI